MFTRSRPATDRVAADPFHDHRRRALVSVIGMLTVAALLVACAADPVGPTARQPTGSASTQQPVGGAAAAQQPADGSATNQQPSEATATTYPLTIDNCGTSVTFRAAPKRVIAIKSTSIEMMFALGLADRIVGVAFPDGPYAAQWAPATPPPVISDKVPGEEATLALKPDLVYAGWESNVSADGAGDRASLAEAGVATFVSPAACQEPDFQPKPLTWDDIFAEIEQMGQIFDVPAAADALVARQRAALAAVQPDGHQRTALWYSSGSKTPYVGGGIGAPELVMKSIGLTNIAADIPMTWSSLSWEAVIAADPDVIVLVNSSWGSTEKKIKQLEGNRATATLTAVKNHQYLIVPFAASEAGVRSVEAVQTLATQLVKLPRP